MRFRKLIIRCLISGVILMTALFAYSGYLIADILGYISHVPRVPPLFSAYRYRRFRYDVVDAGAKPISRCRSAHSASYAEAGARCDDIYAVSAFIDSRALDDEVVRVLALVPRTKRPRVDITTPSEHPLYCVGYYGDAVTNGVRTVAWSGRVSTRYLLSADHRAEYAGVVLTCRRPDVTSVLRACNLGLSTTAHDVDTTVDDTGGVVFLSDAKFGGEENADPAEKAPYEGEVGVDTIGVKVPDIEVSENKSEKLAGTPELKINVNTDELSFTTIIDNDDIKNMSATASINISDTRDVTKKMSAIVSDNRRTLDICVPPLFGNEISSVRLIEFVELSLLQGVQQIHFYDAGISRELLHVLQYYQASGYCVCYSTTRLVDIVYSTVLPG